MALTAPIVSFDQQLRLLCQFVHGAIREVGDCLGITECPAHVEASRAAVPIIGDPCGITALNLRNHLIPIESASKAVTSRLLVLAVPCCRRQPDLNSDRGARSRAHRRGDPTKSWQ